MPRTTKIQLEEWIRTLKCMTKRNTETNNELIIKLGLLCSCNTAEPRLKRYVPEISAALQNLAAYL